MYILYGSDGYEGSETLGIFQTLKEAQETPMKVYNEFPWNGAIPMMTSKMTEWELTGERHWNPRGEAFKRRWIADAEQIADCPMSITHYYTRIIYYSIIEVEFGLIEDLSSIYKKREKEWEQRRDYVQSYIEGRDKHPDHPTHTREEIESFVKKMEERLK